MTKFAIDIDKHANWPMFDAFLSEVISTYRGSASKAEAQFVDGEVEYRIPTQSALSVNIYDTAFGASVMAEGMSGMVTESENNQVTVRERDSDLTGGVSVREDQVAGSTMGSVTRRSGAPLAADGLIEWFQECFDCSGRIEGSLEADIVLPEILVDISDTLDGLERDLDFALELLDFKLGDVCSLFGLGNWCIPDLTTLLAILNSLIVRYSTLAPSIEVSFVDLIGLIFIPILEATRAILNVMRNMALTPIRCVSNALNQMKDLRDEIAGPRPTGVDNGEGLGLNETGTAQSETLSRTFDKVNLSAVRSSLDEVGRVVNSMDPLEFLDLTVKTFSSHITNLLYWLASKVNVLKLQASDMFTVNLDFTSLLMYLARMRTFIQGVIDLTSQGTKVCTTDSDGRYIPTQPIEELFYGTDIIPPWVSVTTESGETGQSNTSGPNIPTSVERFTIIDSSLGTAHTEIGCLGRITLADKAKVDQWIADLDNISTE